MLRWLTYRCLGVACWVYLLALILAGSLYTLLPLSSVIHSWKFDNYIVFQGFTKDYRRLVITELSNGPAVFHHLDVDTGAITTFAAKVHPDEELDFQLIMKKPYRLGISVNEDGIQFDFGLIRPDGTRRHLANTKEIQLSVPGGFSRGVIRYSSGPNDFAITEDEHWLIVNHIEQEPWQPLLLWLKNQLSWDLTDKINGSRFLARIVNLDTLEDYRCDLQSPRRPTFQAHPEGQRFAAFDVRQNDLGTTTEINWHHLPPERGHHTFRQWTAILGVFLTPLLLSLCCSGTRRVRQKRTITMNHRLQTSM